jgi:hypothetical protein
MSAIDDLARRLAPVCESAVSPLEIASALEFDGFSDRAARDGYGADDVFALARELYDRVPRRPAAPPAGDDGVWRPGRFRPALHGALYALPAVCFPAAIALLRGPGVVTVLVTALLAGWGLSQGLAAIGYGRLGSGGPAQAGRVLRAGLMFGLAAAGVAVTVAALAAGAWPPAAVFGAGEVAYMLAAAVLLVTGAERWLLLALAPAAAGSAVYLGLGQPPRLTHLVWAALAATPMLACVLALSRRGTRAHPAMGYAGPGVVPSRTELRSALPAVVLGVLAGGLLALPVATPPDGTGGVNTGALVASVPLALSMGAAEWSLMWYRRRGQDLLRASGDPRWFGARVRLALLTAMAQYAAVMVALVAAAIAVADAAGQVTPGWQVLAAAGGYALLGVAMLGVLLLQAAGVRAVPLLACAAALAAEFALRGAGLTVQLAVPGALAVVITCYALARAGDTTLHT